MVVFVSLACSSIWGFLSLYHRFPNKLLGQTRSQGPPLEVAHYEQSAEDDGVDANQPDDGESPGRGLDLDKNAKEDGGESSQSQRQLSPESRFRAAILAIYQVPHPPDPTDCISSSLLLVERESVKKT